MRRLAPLLLLVALGAMVFLAPGAEAHALLISSQPAQGEQLDRAPAAVTIGFSEPPELAFSRIQVLDQAGASVDAGDTMLVDGEPQSLRVDLGALDEGVYTVAWRVVSKVDGHATGGTFSFGIGVDPAGAMLPDIPIEETPAPSAWEIAARAALAVGLGLLVGAAWVGAAAFREVPGGIWRLALLAWLAAVAGLVVLADVQRRATGASIGAVLDTTLGRALIWRAVAIALAGMALRSARALGGRARAIALAAAGAAAAGAMFVHVSAGHAGAAASPWPPVIAQWAHLVAVGIWLGGLGALLVGIRGQAAETRARAARRFSTVAGVTLFLVLGTGIVRALGELPSLSDLPSSWYGRVVLIKAGLFLALGSLGAVNRYRNVPRAGAAPGGLRRVSRAELALAGLAVIAGGSLATLSPPREAEAGTRGGGAIVVEGADFATTMRVTLEIDPGSAGPNTFTARIEGYDSGDPIDAESVRLLFSFRDEQLADAELALERVEAGVYRGSGAAMGLDGRWQITVVVQREADATEIPLQVATRCRTSPIPVPDGPTLYDVQLDGGRTAQGYVDPGRAGRNEVHITFFDDSGIEMDVADPPAMTATPRGGEPQSLSVRRFGPGHFIGDAQLDAGSYRFDVAGPADDGTALRTCFDETIME